MDDHGIPRGGGCDATGRAAVGPDRDRSRVRPHRDREMGKLPGYCGVLYRSRSAGARRQRRVHRQPRGRGRRGTYSRHRHASVRRSAVIDDGRGTADGRPGQLCRGGNRYRRAVADRYPSGDVPAPADVAGGVWRRPVEPRPSAAAAPWRPADCPSQGAGMIEQEPTRIVVLGGGFAGMYAVMELERLLGRDCRVEITLVNKDNYFVFTPMLHEVAASDLDLTHIVNPIRKLLRRAAFFHGDVLEVDLQKKAITVTHGVDGSHPHRLAYDHLIIALGAVTNFFGTPGLAERAFTMKTLGDAIALRNRIIDSLEEGDFECCPEVRRRMMTFVVAGGGFAGVETVAAVHDFMHEALPHYPRLQASDIRVVLVHPGAVILPELSEKLGRYAQKKLAARGIELRLETKVRGFSADGVELSDGTMIETANLVWTAGTAPNPLI